MSTLQKNNLAAIITLLVLSLTAFQGLIPTIPIKNPATLAAISAVVMFLASGLTAWKQYVSTKISNAAINATLFVFVLSLIGGFNDLFSVISFGDVANQWIRFALTFLTFVVNLASKVLYPSEEGVKI